MDPYRLQQTRSRAAVLKAQGEESSRVRMEAFQEIDRRREHRMAQEMVAREREQRKLMRLLAVVISIVILVAISLAAWQLLG